MQGAVTACKSRTPNVEIVEGTYWISSSTIALSENVKQMIETCRSGDKTIPHKLQYFLGLFVAKDTLSQALRDERHMFT